MQNSIKVYQILISCPSDIEIEIKIINDVCNDFNSTFGKSNLMRLEAVHWKQNVYPQFSLSPQEVINTQIVDESDLIIALFNTKLGSPTENYISGTVEEIYRMVECGKNAFVYFSQIVSSLKDIDINQLAELQSFKKKLGNECFYSEYNSIEEFRSLVSKHVTMYFADILKKKI